MSEEPLLRADGGDGARILQAARDLFIEQHRSGSGTRRRTPLSLRRLVLCFADAPLPLGVLSPETVAAVGVPGLSADRITARVRELPGVSMERVAADGERMVWCVRVEAAALAESAPGLTDDEHARLCAYAAAFLDRAVRLSDGPRLPPLAPHVLALLWHDNPHPTRVTAAARRVRDAFVRRGEFERALPFGLRITELSGPGDLADGLALGQLRGDRGACDEAVRVLRRVLARAEDEARRIDLRVAGRTGPTTAQILRENAHGPFTGPSSAQRDALDLIAAVQHSLGRALHHLRQYAESEQLLKAAVGLLWRVRGAGHPALVLAQMHRAQAVGGQRRGEEAFQLVADALASRARTRLDRDRPEGDALTRLAHAEVTADACRSLREEEALPMEGVGLFPGWMVRRLGRMVSTTRPDGLTPDDARRLAAEAVRACERAFGAEHPTTRAARGVCAAAQDLWRAGGVPRTRAGGTVPASPPVPSHPRVPREPAPSAGVPRRQGTAGGV